MYNILALPLHLNFIEVGIHMINLFILIMAIKIFLYKPIKARLDARAEEMAEKTAKSEADFQKSAELKKQYETLIDGAKLEAIEIKDQAVKSAQDSSAQIIKDAQLQAKEILAKAHLEAKQKSLDEINELKESIGDIACLVAGNILQREVSSSDLDQQISQIVEEWE